MSSRRIGSLIVISALSVGCGANPDSVASPKGTGEIQMTLMRSFTSQIPVQADSALVRVWNDAAGINQLKTIALPAPGTGTSVTFAVPATTGYSVAVVAFRRNNEAGMREGLAIGMNASFSVLADQVNQVSLNVAPLSATISGPDTLKSGQQATYTITAPGFMTEQLLGMNGTIIRGLTPWTVNSQGAQSGPYMGGGESGMQVPITAPTVATDSALYMQAMFSISPHWPADNWWPRFFVPSLTLGERLKRVPVRVPAGAVTITFSPKR